MGVQGFLSLYTMLIGWQVYDSLWDIMAKTGFIALPFAIVAWRSFMEPFMSMGAKDAGIIGSRRFIMQTLTALFVLLFAGVPTVYLSADVLHYKPTCSQSGQDYKPGNTGTTYDQTLPIPKDIKVPIFWYVVLAISNGITDQAEQAISCPDVNLRALQSELNLTTIQDPTLKTQVRRFYKACYMPAYNRFVRKNDDDQQQAEIKHAATLYGNDDTSWIGSETFQTVPGFYDTLSADGPVVGFPYLSGDPQDQIQGQTGDPEWGAPSCQQWWQAPDHGLRILLYNQFSSKFKAILATLGDGGNKNLAEDAAIRAVLMKSSTSGRGYASEEDGKSGIDNGLANVAGKVFTDVAAVEEYPKIHMIENSLPIIQAVLLASVIMLLAFVLPLSCYNVGFLMMGALYLFSITFCSFLWHWISWLDQTLMYAFYGAGSTPGSHHVFRLVLNMAETAVNPEKNLLDITISGFYLFIPFIWMAMTGWAGLNIATGMMGIRESEGMGGKVGGHALNGGSHGLKGSARMLGKGIAKIIK
tara:strand:- start:49563 stop:51146 length:1584 start_codon:yes stop_codon:yes gene_type:complete